MLRFSGANRVRPKIISRLSNADAAPFVAPSLTEVWDYLRGMKHNFFGWAFACSCGVHIVQCIFGAGHLGERA